MSAKRHDVVRAMLNDIANAKYEHRHEVVNDHMPEVICQYVGHVDRPRAFLGWYRTRPWRCNRCHHWLVTVREGDHAGSWWTWEDVTEEVEP